MAANETAKVIEKVQKLITLAQDKDSEEGRNAAIQAINLMREHELVVIPQAELEKARKAVDIMQSRLKEVSDGAKKQQLIWGALGFLAGKQL